MYLRVRHESENTRRAYRHDLKEFFGTSDVTPELASQARFTHVRAHLKDLKVRNLKASTINRKISAVRSFFRWLLAVSEAEGLGLISYNPADSELIGGLPKIRGRERRIVFFSREQAERLVKATEDAGEAAMRDRALIKTLLNCMLRRSEAAAMRFEDIRPAGNYWALDLPHTKGGDEQWVKVAPHVVEAIHDMRQSCGWAPEGPVWRSFSNRNRGDAITPQAIYMIVKRTAARAFCPELDWRTDEDKIWERLDGIGAHALRHTGCTIAIDGGAKIEQVQTYARHADIRTTQRYVHQQEKLSDSATDYVNL
jgi:site-specific recombinase XerD